MAQYDLLLTQNVHASGVEFSEKYVNITKAALLSSDASGNPTVLPGGVNGYQLVRDDAEVTGMKWVSITGGHTQNTDSGTTSLTFSIDSGGYNLPITAESAAKLGFKVAGGTSYADIQAKNAIFAKVTVGAAPSAGSDLTNKDYVDGLLAANDAMIFKGTIGNGGTLTIAAFNAITTYNAGWTYRVIEAGTIRGTACIIGDLVFTIVDRTGTGNANTDFTFGGTNADGTVVGPVSAADNYPALFDGTTGKLIKAGTMALGSAAYLASSTFAPAWVSAPATKTSTGIVGQMAVDANFSYFCQSTNIWKRSPIATNW